MSGEKGGGYGGLKGEEWSSLVGVRNGGIVVNRATLPAGVGEGMVFPQSEHSVDDMLAAWLTSSWFACGLYIFRTHVQSLSLSPSLYLPFDADDLFYPSSGTILFSS